MTSSSPIASRHPRLHRRLRWLTRAGIAASLSLASTAVSGAGDLRSEFQWLQPLDGEFTPGALYRLPAPATVFDGCRRFPSDLRVLDEEGQQWPFYLWLPSERQTVETLPAQTLNTVVVESPERYLRQDLRILLSPATGQAREHNQVTLRTPGRDFIRRVEVYGCEHQAEWGLLGAGYLVDHSRDARAANDTILYPLSTLPLIQVRLFPSASDATGSLSIDHLSAGLRLLQPGEMEPVPLREIPAPDEPQPGNSQVLVFDLDARNRPLERLTIQADDPEYARSVRVSGRNEVSSPWQWFADGEIHRIGQAGQATVRIPGAACRFLKLEIFHHDDRPLTGVRVEAEAVPRYLVFEAGGRKDPALFFGGDVEAPRYDLEQRKGVAAASSAAPANLKPRVSNPTRKAQSIPWLARHGRWLAALAVGAVSVLVVWVILGMVKRQSGWLG